MTLAQLKAEATVGGVTAPLWYHAALRGLASPEATGASAPSSAGQTSHREPCTSGGAVGA